MLIASGVDLRFIWYSHFLFMISFQAQTLKFYPWATFANKVHAAVCVFSMKEMDVLASLFCSVHDCSAFVWKLTFVFADLSFYVKSRTIISVSDGNVCQKYFFIVLEHCDTNSLSLMLHIISNQLLNIMCTSTFIRRIDARIVFYFKWTWSSYITEHRSKSVQPFFKTSVSFVQI